MKREIEPLLLEEAINEAVGRYPYLAVEVVRTEDDAYEVVRNNRPIKVYSSEEPLPALGSDENNGHLIFAAYERCEIRLCSHLTLGGGSIFREFSKTVLYLYLTKQHGTTLPADGIRLPGQSLLDGEEDVPGIEKLDQLHTPVEPPTFEDAFTVYRNDMPAMMTEKNSHYRLRIPEKDMMAYARAHGASPSSALVVLMFRALSNLYPDTQMPIRAGVAHNYREAIGAPNSHHDFVDQLFLTFQTASRQSTDEELNVMSRNMMREQMRPELVQKAYKRKVLDAEDTVDGIRGLEEKREWYQAHGRKAADANATFYLSYVGKTDWGALAPYVESVFLLCEGHLMLEVITCNGFFCIAFLQMMENDKYVRALARELDSACIPYELEGPFETGLPGVELP